MPVLQDTDHTTGRDLEMYVQGKMQPGQTSLVDAHLLKCPMCREHLSTHVGMQLADCAIGNAKLDRTNRRSEPRFHTRNDAIVQELNPLSLDRQSVKIVDISKHGI
jgi:anti-sigma factor RsiW